MNENMRIEISETYLKSRTYIASPDYIVSQSNKMPNKNYSGKNNHWCFAYYLQLENKITVIIPLMSHSTRANILNKLNSSVEMFTCTQ